jgi:hypothetical protein
MAPTLRHQAKKIAKKKQQLAAAQAAAKTNPKRKAPPKKDAQDSDYDEEAPNELMETTLSSMTPAQMTVFMNLVKQAGGKVTEAGEKECKDDREEDLDPGKYKPVQPKKARNAPNLEEPAPEPEADRLLNLCLQGQAKKAKKGMENLIREVVRSHLFRIIKFITCKEVEKIAVKKVRIWLNFSAMQGDDVESARRKKEFDESYGPVVTRLLNEHRSYVSSQIKEVMHKNWQNHNSSLPTPEQLVKLIGRDFALGEGEPGLDQEDYDLLKWWITELLPKACGTQAEWGPDHHFYMTVQKGAPANRPKRHYVTSSTEAFAVWVIENNRVAWPAQWLAKAQHGNYGIIRKTKGPNGEELTPESSTVSILILFNLPLIWMTFYPTHITFGHHLLRW